MLPAVARQKQSSSTKALRYYEYTLLGTQLHLIVCISSFLMHLNCEFLRVRTLWLFRRRSGGRRMLPVPRGQSGLRKVGQSFSCIDSCRTRRRSSPTHMHECDVVHSLRAIVFTQKNSIYFVAILFLINVILPKSQHPAHLAARWSLRFASCR